jgi:hypothetical protein
MYSDRRYLKFLPRGPEEVDAMGALRSYRVVQVLMFVLAAGCILGFVLG